MSSPPTATIPPVVIKSTLSSRSAATSRATVRAGATLKLRLVVANGPASVTATLTRHKRTLAKAIRRQRKHHVAPAPSPPHQARPREAQRPDRKRQTARPLDLGDPGAVGTSLALQLGKLFAMVSGSGLRETDGWPAGRAGRKATRTGATSTVRRNELAPAAHLGEPRRIRIAAVRRAASSRSTS